MMSIYFLTTALLIVSSLTNLTVEGFKKLFKDTNIKYSSNILAVIFSVIIALALSIFYLIMNDIPFTSKVCVEIIVLIYLSFLTSTVGHDKVVQTISQLKGGKNDE